MKMIFRSVVIAALGLLIATGCFAQQQNSSIAVTPVVQNAAYASGNAMGGLQTMPFLQAARAGVINSATIYSKGGGTTALTIYLFDTNPTASTCTDKSAFSLAAADISKLIVAPFVLTPAVVGVGTTTTLAQSIFVIPARNFDVPSTGAVYACIVSGGIWTPATVSDLVFKLTASFIK